MRAGARRRNGTVDGCPELWSVAGGVRDFRALVGRVWALRSTSQTEQTPSDPHDCVRAVRGRDLQCGHTVARRAETRSSGGRGQPAPAPGALMELNRMKGEVSEELRRSFEGWTMTTRLRQHASADCFYRPDGRRTRILAALPREFTYADLKRVIKSHGGSKVDERIMATHLNHQTSSPSGSGASPTGGCASVRRPRSRRRSDDGPTMIARRIMRARPWTSRSSTRRGPRRPP